MKVFFVIGLWVKVVAPISSDYMEQQFFKAATYKEQQLLEELLYTFTFFKHSLFISPL